LAAWFRRKEVESAAVWTVHSGLAETYTSIPTGILIHPAVWPQ